MLAFRKNGLGYLSEKSLLAYETVQFTTPEKGRNSVFPSWQTACTTFLTHAPPPTKKSGEIKKWN
jgi:hypothetical protein